MKKIVIPLAAAILLAGLIGGVWLFNSGAKEDGTVYRGIVTQIGENSLWVKQAEGQNYGAPEVVFQLNSQTVAELNGMALAEGSFVEVWHSGVFTQSLPPQATAARVVLISTMGENVVLNGTVVGVETDENGDFRLELAPVVSGPVARLPEEGSESNVILLVPAAALEGLAAEDLADGLVVSAVTRGIATLSSPPQFPVLALLPYTAAVNG